MGPETGHKPPCITHISGGFGRTSDCVRSQHLLICLDTPFQVQHLFFDLGHDGEKGSVLLAAGVLQSPVLTVGAGKGRALDLTSHRDHQIHRGQLGKGLAVLLLLHVDAIDLLHQTQDALRPG